MAVPIITTGDPIELYVTLYNNGAVVNLSGTMKAAIQDGTGITLIASTTQSSSYGTSDWTNGLVGIYFPASANVLFPGDAFLEIEYTATSDGIARTWPLIPLLVQAGVIS
jgi:hypothetical protein